MDMLVVFSTQLDEYHLYLGNFLGFVASMVCFQENVFPGFPGVNNGLELLETQKFFGTDRHLSTETLQIC